MHALFATGAFSRDNVQVLFIDGGSAESLSKDYRRIVDKHHPCIEHGVKFLSLIGCFLRLRLGVALLEHAGGYLLSHPGFLC